jgi:hypothetical protein
MTMVYPEERDPRYKEKLKLLVTSGFAELDSERTTRVRKAGSDLLIYRWTEQGYLSCSCSAYRSPMSWALEMAEGARHCTVCGTDRVSRSVAASGANGATHTDGLYHANLEYSGRVDISDLGRTHAQTSETCEQCGRTRANANREQTSMLVADLTKETEGA